MMIRNLQKRRGSLLPLVLVMLMMLSIISTASLGQLSAFLSGVEAGGDGLQAKQYASIKADAITSYTAAADEARTLYPGSEFETETIIGPETDLGSGNKQKIATVNVYKTGDSTPRFTLLKPLSTQGSGNLPIGTIAWYAAAIAPEGWIECNGQSTAAYPALAAIVGSNVPDLRGRFIRGWSHDSLTDSSRIFGSYQSSANLQHSHFVVNSNYSHGFIYGINAEESMNIGNSDNNGEASYLASGSSLPATKGKSSISGENESRPVNVALLPIIKAQ